MSRERIRATVLALVVLVASLWSAPSSALPPRPAGHCVSCRVISFGPFLGREYICGLVYLSGFQNCRSGEGWCINWDQCRFYSV